MLAVTTPGIIDLLRGTSVTHAFDRHVYDRFAFGANGNVCANGWPIEQAVTTWVDLRNQAAQRIDWQITTADVCTKLRCLYAAFEA